MGFLKDDKPPPFYVPDVTKPAGAEIAADGTVTCVSCASRLPVADADIVGQGYRCSRCSADGKLHQLTTGRADVASNLSELDRRELRVHGKRMAIRGIGALLCGIGVIWFSYPVGCVLATVGIGWIAVGRSRIRAAG